MSSQIIARLAKLEKEQNQVQTSELGPDNPMDRIRQRAACAMGNEKDYFDTVFEYVEIEEPEDPKEDIGNNEPPLIVCFETYHGEGIESTFRHQFILGLPNSTLYQKKQEDGTWTPWQTYNEMYPPDQINGTLPELEPTETPSEPTDTTEKTDTPNEKQTAKEIEEEALEITRPTKPTIPDIDLEVRAESGWKLKPKY
jgi:hypothetical protein